MVLSKFLRRVVKRKLFAHKIQSEGEKCEFIDVCGNPVEYGANLKPADFSSLTI